MVQHFSWPGGLTIEENPPHPFPLTCYRQIPQAFSHSYLTKLERHIRRSPYFTDNNLNRDFVATKGFSVVFRNTHLAAVTQAFPYFQTYLQQALLPECNAFYLNPLLLAQGSRVDPHVDRSLRSYCKTIHPPFQVSVLYVQVPPDLVGGELVLRARGQRLAQISPCRNTLLFFAGDLTHAVNPVLTPGYRLSLVCEQYILEPGELSQIPSFTIESRAVQNI